MAVELAVEVAVEFQSGSRKKSGCRKTPHPKKDEQKKSRGRREAFTGSASNLRSAHW